ncbi:MAG: GH116 family glycosyl hydrolase [bacterium]
MKRTVVKARTGEKLSRVAFPMGGIGAGMISLEGTGALSQVSLRHRPDVLHEPQVFAALYVKGSKTARVLEGQVPMWKVLGATGEAGSGFGGRTYGLPRFAKASFQARFPFATVSLADSTMPVTAELTGWSPFTPGAADDSSLPVAAIEYRFTNHSTKTVKAVFSFHAANFMRTSGDATVGVMDHGFVLAQPQVEGSPDAEGRFAAFTDDPSAVVDAAWFRGGWFDSLTTVWNHVAAGDVVSQPPHAAGAPSGGGSLYVPFTLKAGAGKTVRLQFAWYVPRSGVRVEGRPHTPPGDEPFIADGWQASRLMPAGDISHAPYMGLAEDIGWEAVPVATSGLVDVHELRGQGGIVYLARNIRIDADCERVLHVGHDGGARVFLDGKALAVTPGTVNPATSTRTQVRVALSQGEHELCVAFDRAGGNGWGIFVSLQRPPVTCGAGCNCSGAETRQYLPWYAARFGDLEAVAAYWRKHYERLRSSSALFSDCFYDTTLPAEVIESVAANLSIIKSPTCLRQADGRLWGWEGCNSGGGCCSGSCTHVWNYAQAIPHLFPELERTLRETEFLVNQDARGHQMFRAALPIGPVDHWFHAAADGQLGGLMKLYREWRISGDTGWMKKLWPAAKQGLDYCIATWDPDRNGTIVEPHHNTYDIEFWGADGMCTSFYLGALAAAIAMGLEVGEDVSAYEALQARGRKAMARTLWNGAWFAQKVQWKGLRAGNPLDVKSMVGQYTPEAMAILEREGPKYQYGGGCLSDGVLGDWIARCSGLGPVLDEKKTTRHLASIFKYNFRESLVDHANPQRPGYAFPQEGGLLLCSWPKDDKPALPFVYSDEVWTGIEYQVASHLIMTGQVKEGLAVVQAVRNRYDGQWRNPFDEYECGHWYARAMSSYGLLQAMSGAQYDAVDQVLYLDPKVKGDFRAFLCTGSGYGTVGVKKGKPFIEVVSGSIPVKRLEFRR